MSTSVGRGAAVARPPFGTHLRRLYDRKLLTYPNTGARAVYLALTVLATIGLYYELYIQGAVATKIILVFLVTGRWSPRKAKQDYIEHEQMVQREVGQAPRQGGLT